MVERLAEFLARRARICPPDDWSWKHDITPREKKRYRSDARELFAAIREPTEAMLEAAFRVDNSAFCYDGYKGISKEEAPTVWHDMIDEALKETP
jgi:hypothetical protein